MIEVKNVTKSFGSFKALDDLSMHVEAGSIYGLVGPNGAGKSTIIRHIMGIYSPDGGEITIDGQPVFENPSIKARTAYIPDNFYFFLNDNLRDLMLFYRGIYPNFSMERYEKLREAFPTIDEKRSLRRLSKGMQKQVAFWMALCCMPDVVILDEPVDGLDPMMRRQVWSLLMADVAERGTTVLVSSHNLRELEDVCDHVGFMHKGRLVLERSLCDLQDQICKLQVVFDGELPTFPPALAPLHISNAGRVYTIIIKQSAEAAMKMLEAYSPLMMDALPLSLEEIFIYELGGEDYGIKEILL